MTAPSPSDKCLLICGGVSDEHHASVHTAATVFRYLSERDESTAVVLYVSETGKYFYADREAILTLQSGYRCDIERLKRIPCEIRTSGSGLTVFCPSSGESVRIRVAFPLILGNSGEDGGVYEFLRFCNVPTVGPSGAVSRALFDKEEAKGVFARFDVPALSYAIIHSEDEVNSARSTTGINYPCVVKPARQGSSIGLCFCEDEAAFRASVQASLQFDNKIIVEPLIEMTEHCCYVWRGMNGIRSSQTMAILPKGGRYDFAQKYIDFGNVKFEYQSDSEMSTKLRNTAEVIYRGLRGGGIWRFDFFIEPNEKVWINEVNTVPAFVNVYGKEHLLNRGALSFRSVLEDVVQQATCAASEGNHNEDVCIGDN